MDKVLGEPFLGPLHLILVGAQNKTLILNRTLCCSCYLASALIAPWILQQGDAQFLQSGISEGKSTPYLW